MARDNKEEINEMNEINEMKEVINETIKEEMKGGVKKKKAKGNVVSNREYRMRKKEIINMNRRVKRIKDKAVITPKPE